MKLFIIITFFLLISSLCLSQDNSDETAKLSYSKSDLIGTWRACGGEDWDESADTLTFQHPTPNCRDNDCGEHNWIFRESGSVEFIFTNGCGTGFHSVSKNPKRWLFMKKSGQIKMITNDGYVEYFDIKRLDDKLIIIHRRDLELD